MSDDEVDDRIIELAHQLFDGGPHLPLYQDQVGDRDPMMRIDVAR